MEHRNWGTGFLVLSLALADCGGGGASSSTPTSGSTKPPPVTTAPPPTSTAPPPASTGFSAKIESATPAPAAGTSSVVYGTPYTFTGSAAGGTAPYSYSWNFGDGFNSSGTLSPAHTYANSGSFTALLAVTDAASHVASATATITIPHTAPTVTVSGPPAGNTGTPLTFIAAPATTSVADWFTGFTYHWNFGDGTTASSTDQALAHTFAASGTYTVSVTATDQEGMTSAAGTTQIVVSAPNVIAIDQNWLQQNGPAPYVLNQAGATYQLQTDVTANGTAFVVLAPNVTLDLNSHTITYGNSAPVTVTNGGFESGSGTNVPDWNITGAPAAALAPNTNYLWGNQVLRLSNFSTPQTFISGPIPISLINHTYEATITMANPNVDYRTTVQLSVIDATTGKVLGSGTSPNPNRGFSADVAFTPTTSDPVEFQVVVTPPTGITDTFLDFDAATLTLSDDYGILATSQWQGDIPGFANLPTSIQTIYNHGLNVKNFTLTDSSGKQGGIVQGQGDGYGSNPLFFEFTSGITINGVSVYTDGMDTDILDAYDEGVISPGNVVITNSTFSANVSNISDRLRDFSALDVSGSNGAVLIQGNQILGVPQIGIYAGGNNPEYPYIVNNNIIKQNNVVANGYAIVVAALGNFQITNNQIEPASGGGIDIDGFSSTPNNLGLVSGNYVSVVEKPNREYPLNYARALRFRNDVNSQGGEFNLLITDNSFIATAEPDYYPEAFGGSISLTNTDGAMNNANDSIVGNLFEGISLSAGAGYEAKGIIFDGMDPGINLKVANNTFESNNVSLGLSGVNGGTTSGLTLIGNTFEKASTGAAMSYTGIAAGYWTAPIQNIQIISPILTNGANDTIAWSGPGTKSVALGWQLTVHVANASGSALPGAVVQVNNAAGGFVYAGATDANGNATVNVGTTLYQQQGTDPGQIATTNLNPYSITVTDGSKTATVSVSPTSMQTVTLALKP